MNSRATELIELLGLEKHPEGGYYREKYRSPLNINQGNSLMTSIYFLLTYDDPSKFHRIQSDEHWYFHEGSSLTIHLLNENGHQIKKLGLDLNEGQNPYHLVKGNTIFGSEVIEKNAYSLVSCAVAPGFEFKEFELFKKEELIQLFPNEKEIINRLT